MMNTTRTTKRWISGGMMAVFVSGLVLVGLFVSHQRAQAQESLKAVFEAAQAASVGACLRTGAMPTVCLQEGTRAATKVVLDKIFSPAFRVALIQGLLNLSQFVLDRLAYEAAVAIASGGPGQDSLFYDREPADAFKQLGLEVAGEAVGIIQEASSEELGLKFNICKPSLGGGAGGANLDIALALGIKQKYQPAEPKCDILKVGKNWEGFLTNIYQGFTDPNVLQERVLSTFAQTLKPGKNELSASLRFNIAVDQEVTEQKLVNFQQMLGRDFKPVKDFFTGNIKTPADVLGDRYKKALDASVENDEQVKVKDLVGSGELIGGLALSVASTFTNTLLSQLLNRVYTGLFDTPRHEIDPFDIEALGRGGKKAAQERFASVIATNPIATTPYNALAEFAVCTAGTGQNRGLNDCVVDVNFLAAVSRGNSGAGVTVQEAIEEGLLNGDWPLISPDNLSANQDPFCYTYGYCYGNMVKLRKARVIPIGWELAALRNSVSQPATLQEIVDRFNDCTQDGTIGPASAGDSSSKWCHLIDPNWVLKYPETQCRATGFGEIRIGNSTPGRAGACVDAPSCIGEDNNGNCANGFGYCVQEKNVWRFRGDECPSQYATCLAFENSRTKEAGDFLVNTVDYSVCDQQNAGCRWYRTNKSFDDHDTPATPTDDSYEWLPSGDTYITAAHDTEFGDRLYLTDDATSCATSDAGCTRLFAFAPGLALNSLRNPSFEDDEDDDGAPDGWSVIGGTPTIDTSVASYGSASVRLEKKRPEQLEQFVDVSDRNFYTFSAYFRGAGSGAIGDVRLELLDEDGDNIDAAGTSSSGDCIWSTGSELYLINTGELAEDSFERQECTFTVPAGTQQVRVLLGTNFSANVSDVYVDAVQLELGENPSFFTDGYSQSPTPAYYKVAPDYLGCTGSPNDPKECGSYARACTAQDVGCNLYTPRDGDPSVPAIISSLDACPSECVGYTTYKQEATAYESDDFPLYLIADSASACAAQYVGCDAYTNLASAAEGGEGVEHYTDLRFCLTPAIADSSSTAVTPSTYFTWEGSDNAGYQLQTWYLLDSNYTGAIKTFQNSGYTETDPERAPCTHILMTGLDDVVCRDTPSVMNTDVWNNAACDSHADIFDNPDCREFFDTQGNIHYRQYSDTISISDQCTPYRKDAGNEVDCEGSGGFWADQGFCRYYVLPQESVACPAQQNGCREYTGGAGRNAATILTQNFEGGTYEDFVMADVGVYPSTIAISSESVATEGHSLFVETLAAGAGAGIETVQISNPIEYDEDTASSCSGTVTDAGCELAHDVDGFGGDDETCTISDGQQHCGTLVGSLTTGKTFVLEFWAKGSSSLAVSFVEEGGAGTSRNFVDPANSDDIPDTLALTGAWQLYSLGPIDTSLFANFDETAVLRFTLPDGGELYLDNIALKQVEENITLIKDSWVVPSTCDVSPSGSPSPQYYLGCEAYTDQRGNDANLYQFSDVCSEEVVGCQGFFDSANSESVYTQVFNARCVYSTDDDFADGELAPSNTACTIDDTTYCTVATGRGYCTFDVDTTLPSPLPETDADPFFAIVYGPEAVEVPGDAPVYIVADSKFACGSAAMGCEEVGNPKFSQDHSQVESFASSYYLNRPADYGNILCDQEALFCEEWTSTQDGNFYFKDPLDKECEYKTGVVIANRPYFGWFRAGTQEPCDWEDTNLSGSFEIGVDAAYLIAGEQYGVWRNGDGAYDGWVASCEEKYDRCTEFVDVADTGAGSGVAGKSYYFTNDELLDEENLLDTQRCEGRVSQKFGCALFNNTTVSELFYNAGASYLASVHADILYGREANTLVDPVSCTVTGGGEFTISASDAAALGTGTSVNVCERRCSYAVDNGDTIRTPSAQAYTPSSVPVSLSGEPVHSYFYERSCLSNADCPVLTTGLGEDVNGSCQNVASTYRLSDDTNEILKVNRDRTCASWLACESSRTSWNAGSNTYDTICDSINLCVEGKQQGDRALCEEWDGGSPEVLSAYQYSARDVNWTGYEYSGLAIPNQLPAQYYDQFNIQARAVCVYGGDDVDEDGDPLSGEIPSDAGADGLPMACGSFEDCGTSPDSSCTQDSDCTSNSYAACDEDSGECYYACENVSDTDYRLVYNAGPCDSTEEGDGNGGLCTVGHCEDTGVACAVNADCSSGEDCVVGYLQATGKVDCENAGCTCNPSANADDGRNDACLNAESATGLDTNLCDPAQFVCVDEFITPDNEDRVACVSSQGGRTCVPSATSTVGSCFNDRCLADIVDANGDGRADRLAAAQAREQACRAYPEVDSPYSIDVVSTWKTFTVDNIEANSTSPLETTATVDEIPTEPWSIPYQFVGGFKDSTVCGLDANSVSEDCQCSYNKAQYGSGSAHKYFSTETGFEEVESATPGVCSGGTFAGIPCVDDRDCKIDDNNAGTCSQLTRIDTLYGWIGYCIERDTSIQLFGSTAPSDQACLTWLPVDQLSGATDLYGKYTTAGFAPQNTYYCAEVDTSYTVRTSDIACAETQDNFCNDDGSNWENFRGDADNSTPGRIDGIGGVWCPEGFFAVMTGCGNLSVDLNENGVQDCSADDGDNDSPYFCVPKLSYKTQNDGEHTQGDPCLSPGGLGYDFTTEDGAYFVDLEDVEGHWAGSERPDIRVYVAPPAIFTELYDIYDDCEVRGVVEHLEEYTGSGGVDDLLTEMPIGTLTCAANPGIEGCCEATSEWECGFRGLENDNFIPAAACTSVVQVASKTLEYDDGLEESYNAAWTNRLWSGQNDATLIPVDQRYTIQVDEDDAAIFGYQYGTPASPYGAAVDYRALEGQTDVEPHQLAMCQEDSADWDQVLPLLAEVVCPAGWLEPLSDPDARAYREVSVTNHESLVEEDDGVVVARLKQLFGRIYRVVEYEDGYHDVGSFEFINPAARYAELEGFENFVKKDWDRTLNFSTAYLDWIWDSRATRDNPQDHAPKVVSVGQCAGTECKEGVEGRFSLNEIDSGDIEGAGAKRVTLSFFAYADSEQMPIRRMVVDWGDDFTSLNGDLPWPTGNQSGSTASNNFYKNHRGLNPDSGVPICSSDADEFGRTPQACSTSYVSFNHDYVCSPGRLADLVGAEAFGDRQCDYADDGRLLNSPCYEDDQYCVFQPRVHILDNWGWCTGFCDAGEDETDGCYSGVLDTALPNPDQDECNIEFCPSEGESGSCDDEDENNDGDYPTVNPWVNFDGTIRILAE